jgi:hypothetical protein
MTGDVGSAWQRHRAARTVASQARDAQDLAELLDMLGLTAAEGREPFAEPPPAAPKKPVPRLDPPTACRLNDLLRPGSTERTASSW